MLQRSARLGLPLPMAKMPAALAEPDYAVAIGMIYYAQRARVLKNPQEMGFREKLKALFSKAGLGN
jgi:cell division protein FtsA